MSDRLFDVGQVRMWLNSGLSGSTATITLSELRETPEGVVADYDTPSKIGRVTCWFAGFCDFEV